MPEATLRAFADHGDVARAARRRARRPRSTLRRAAAAGIDLDAITAELEREGVRSFCDSYHELLALHRDEAPPRRARGARNRAARRHVTVAPAEAGRRDPAG